jgi:hypothetical protein
LPFPHLEYEAVEPFNDELSRAAANVVGSGSSVPGSLERSLHIHSGFLFLAVGFLESIHNAS